jgi:hypothetical protein
MYIMGSWEMGLGTDPNFSQSFRDNLDVIKFPVLVGGKGIADDTLAWFGGNYIVNAKSKNKALALEYLKMFAEKFPAYAWEAGAAVPAQKVTPRPTDTVAAKKSPVAAEAMSPRATRAGTRARQPSRIRAGSLPQRMAASSPGRLLQAVDAAAVKVSKE